MVAGALWWVPPAETLGEAGRVFFFHVPVAWVSVLAFLSSLWYSVKVLRKGCVRDDIRARTSAELGLWFCVMATVTGAIFAKRAWNAYWNWDPRETSIVFLLLIYIAYFALRSVLPRGRRMMKASAAYAIFAAAVMPYLVFIVPRVFMSLHPDTVINGRGAFELADPRMKIVFFAALAGFTMIYHILFTISVRIENLERSEELRNE